MVFVEAWYRITQKVDKETAELLEPYFRASAEVFNRTVEIVEHYLEHEKRFPKTREFFKEAQAEPLSSALANLTQRAAIGAIKAARRKKKRVRSVQTYPILISKRYIYFRLAQGNLALPARRGYTPIEIHFSARNLEKLKSLLESNAEPRSVQIIKGPYGVYAYVLLSKEVSISSSTKVMGVDLGEVHPYVSYDGDEVIIWNGRLLRSLRQRYHKLLAKKQSLLSKHEKGSRRWGKIKESFDYQIGKTLRQIDDLEHKIAARLADYAVRRGVGLVVVEGLNGLHKRVGKLRKKSSQKIHSWPYRRLVRKLELKLAKKGIRLEKVDPKDTSKTCPRCGEKNTPRNRQYYCKSCGLVYHRDAVGAVNLYLKASSPETIRVDGLPTPRGVKVSW